MLSLEQLETIERTLCSTLGTLRSLGLAQHTEDTRSALAAVRGEIWNAQRALRNAELKLIRDAEEAGRVSISTYDPIKREVASRLKPQVVAATSGAELLAILNLGGKSNAE